MAPMWIDTHCHLDAREFDADRDAVAARAAAAGVTQIIVPAVDVAGFEGVRALAQRHGYGYALGIHPLAVEQAADDDLERLRDALDARRDDPLLVAVGEIGIDGFVAGLDAARQERWCARQLELAAAYDLPVIVHSRHAVDRVLKLLRRHRVPGGIAHAFNGSLQQAENLIELGFRLGFGGAMTFERALRIRRLAEVLPLEAIVVETDAPDIPPYWLYRSAAERAAGAVSRNEPAELPRIAATLAELRGIPIDALAQATSVNARAVFTRLP